MKLYSDVGTQRFGQFLGDLMLVVWVWVCVELGLLVYRITDALGAPGRKAAEAGDGLAGDLRKLSEPIGKVPAVGDQLRSPIDGAAGAAGKLAQAGRDEAHAVEQLAYVLAGVTIALPGAVRAADLAAAPDPFLPPRHRGPEVHRQRR